MSFWKYVCLGLLIGGGWNAAADSAAPLRWDQTNEFYTAKVGEVSARFTFNVRNVSDTETVVDDVKTSCGCTVAQLPSKPWHLAPGETNRMEVLVDLRGKWGRLYKTIDILSSNATTMLGVVIDIPEGSTNAMSPEMANRMWGQQLAALDHQAVFKKDCVKCHLEPAFGKTGQSLYHVACGICHASPHRATMVPDLRALKTPIDENYWRHWITYGKPGTLMPGFAATLGGPLDEEQIKSLADYLGKTFPRPLKEEAQTEQDEE